jgi:hypothetical protein
MPAASKNYLNGNWSFIGYDRGKIVNTRIKMASDNSYTSEGQYNLIMVILIIKLKDYTS